MDIKLLTKREIQAILLAHYAAFILGKRVEGFRIEIWQKKPRTDARVCVNWRGIEFYDIGFASMNYKDTWDAKYGERMAIHKAIAGIAKQIAYGQRTSARFEVLVPPLIIPVEEAQSLRTQVEQDLKSDVKRLRDKIR